MTEPQFIAAAERLETIHKQCQYGADAGGELQ
jgi:hypothetical protein